MNSTESDFCREEKMFDPQKMKIFLFQVNNETVLTMSFDRSERKLFVQDAKENEVVSLTYSDKFRLVSINRRGFVPVVFSYREADGKLSSWKFGGYTEEFVYDTRGRLIEIQRFEDLSSIKFSYGLGEQVRFSSRMKKVLNKMILLFQPVGISYGSQSTVMLRKDSSGSVNGIIMPNQAEHNIEYRPYFNGYRLIYTGIHQQIWEFDSDSNLRRVYLPSGRMITNKFDEENRLVYSFADGFLTSFSRDGRDQIRRKTFPRGEILDEILSNDEKGSLQSSTIVFNSRNLYEIVRLKFWSSNSFEIGFYSSDSFDRSLIDNFPWKFLSNYSSKLDERTGFLQSNSLVRFSRPTLFETFVKDNSNLITIFRRVDEQKRLKEMNFGWKNEKRLSVEIFYNEKTLLVDRMKISLNELEKVIYRYEYDSFKRLTTIRKNDELVDRFSYDLNNNLNSTLKFDKIFYNSWNQIEKILVNKKETILYEYDDDAFLKSISDGRKFIFNSFGLLTKFKSNENSIEYFYDAENRLSMKIDSANGIHFQFVYGNPLNRRQITNIFDFKENRLTSIFYDENNFIVGFQQNKRNFFVLTDSIGSPLFVYDQNGSLVLERFYSSFGSILIEKNFQENIFFPFAHGGTLFDQHLNCAFDTKTGKLFDPALGRFLVANFPSNWFEQRARRAVINDPFKQFNLYQIDSSIYNVNELFFNQIRTSGKKCRLV